MIKKYSNYIKESAQTVYLNDNKDGPGFYTNKYGPNSIATLNSDILQYITDIYKEYGFSYQGGNKDIDVNGILINTEYIDKMVNNYTIFKTFIRENDIKNEIDFYRLIRSKFYDVYNYNGDFFNRQTLPILINTTRKGNINEAKCKQKFTDYAKSKGLNIVVVNPTIEEDVKGIDGKFNHNGVQFTIQIKPFSEYKIIGDKLYAKSAGSLSIGSVNYLILYSDKEYIIISNKKLDPIAIKGQVFKANLSNVLYHG